MLKFNGALAPDFIKIQRVDISVLPTVATNLKTLGGSYGNIAGKSSFGEKIIKAYFVAVIPKGKSLQACSREMAVWLKGNDFKESDLELLDDEGFIYKAKINNSVDLTDMLFAGSGSFEFLVPSGVAETANTSIFTGNSPLTIPYSGTAPASPIIHVTVGTQVQDSNIKITNVTTGEIFMLYGSFEVGDKIEINCSKYLVKHNGKVNLKVIGFNSKFFQISKTSQISCSNSGSQLKVEVKERYI